MVSLEQLQIWRRYLHQIPEIGFQEFKTQEYLLHEIEKFKKDYFIVEKWRTGLFVFIQGISPQKTLGWRTDIDALSIQEESNCSFTSNHQGLMHACGHDFHMAIALGIAEHFSQKRPTHNILLIFQPAEEGPGGALLMMESEFYQNHKIDLLMALHVAPEEKVGSIALKTETLFANTSELFIKLYGKGGHAAFPHLTSDMVIASSFLVTQLQTIISRNISPIEAGVITIGQLQAGSRQNIIAHEAYLAGTIRTLNEENMILIKKRIQEMLEGISQTFSCTYSLDFGANYAQVYNHIPETLDFIQFAEKEVHVKICPPAMTGEDFGYFLKSTPGFLFWLGVDSPFGLHHHAFSPQEEAMKVGLNLVLKYLTHKDESWKNS